MVIRDLRVLGDLGTIDGRSSMLSLVTMLSDSSESLGGTKVWDPADVDLGMASVTVTGTGTGVDDVVTVAVEPGDFSSNL